MENDISAMLKQVMENPQFGAMVSALQNGGQGDGGTGEAPRVDTAKMMEKLPELMTMLGPMLSGSQTEGGTMQPSEDGHKEEKEPPEKKEREEKGENTGDPASSGAMAALFRPGSREKRNKLLAALKPYLSPGRCAIIDRAMSAMQLGELLGTMPAGPSEKR